MTNPTREEISVPRTSPWAERAHHLLVYAQSLLLGLYKREYQARGNHPPLTYRIHVQAEPYTQGCTNSVLATYHVSPDIVRLDNSRPGWGLHGVYFEIGRGWIFPEPGFTRANLWLQPRPGRVLRYHYQFVPIS